MVCKHIKQVMLMSFVLMTLFSHAQKDKLPRVQTLLTQKKFDEAKLCVDSAAVHPETKVMFETWTLRAFVYFEFYKKTDKFKLNSTLRDTIIRSLKRSNELNPDEDFKRNNVNLLNNMAGSYHAIAKVYLQDSTNYEMSSKAYAKFKETIKLADPNYNYNAKDVEYYQAVGYVYSDMFNKDNNNTKALEIAKVALFKVLEIQPNDPGANMNMGLMYLNNAINLIKKIDDVENFKELDMIQDNAIKLAKQSEQFILRVYNKDNTNKKAIEGLYYVYKLLNDDAKKLEFKNKCIAAGISITKE